MPEPETEQPVFDFAVPHVKEEVVSYIIQKSLPALYINLALHR